MNVAQFAACASGRGLKFRIETNVCMAIQIFVQPMTVVRMIYMTPNCV